MAKNYVKPNIAFQKLAMSADLSAGCSVKLTFAEFVCPVLIPEWGETVFSDSQCDWTNGSDFICYHVPTASTNVYSA